MKKIVFSGPAGSGVNTAGLIVSNYLTKLGYNIYGDKEYQSIIKGGNNSFIVYFSKDDVYLSNKLDLAFVYDKLAIERLQENYEIENIIELENKPEYFVNIVSVALFFKIIGLKKEETIKIVKDFFGGKIPESIWEKNLNSIEVGYNFDRISGYNQDFRIETGFQDDKILIDGNELVAESAVKSGLEFYSAYPMTPASTLINYITKHKEVTFFQGEDEIAVAMSMLGARFAGKKAMCGTSGGGFALMTETISFANQAEIGGIYVLSQRAGPSTGTPTYTEQGDLLYTLNASFGDTKPIVVYPSSFENTPKLISKVFNWADIYQHPIIVLLDKQFSESYISQDCRILTGLQDKNDNFDKIRFNEENKEEFGGINDLENNKFLRYKITEDGISPYTYPGIKNGEFIATSYEHTESGATSENSQVKKQMTEKRHKKMETFIKNEFNEDFAGFTVYNENAKKFFITMGINTLTLKKYIKDNPEYGLISVEVLQPVDKRLKEFLNNKNIEKLIFVELNYSGQLEKTLKCELDLNCAKFEITHIRKYNNMPLFLEDIKNEN